MSSPTPSTSTAGGETSSSESRWLDWFTSLTRGSTAEEKAEQKIQKECATCETWKSELQSSSPIVRFMTQHIALLSPPDASTSASVPITCAPCDDQQFGGFSPSEGILLCANKIPSKKYMEDTLAHEMVHLFDERRFQVDWSNLKMHACSEIRAANLSGDCRLMREWTRRHFGLSAQHQTCVKRRAVLSVAMNPACPNKEAAEQAVDSVWKSCLEDTRPFDRVY